MTVIAMKRSMPSTSARVWTMTYWAEPFAYDFVALAMTIMPYIAQMTLIVKRNMSARCTKSRNWGRNFFKALTSIQGIWHYEIITHSLTLRNGEAGV